MPGALTDDSLGSAQKVITFQHFAVTGLTSWPLKKKSLAFEDVFDFYLLELERGGSTR